MRIATFGELESVETAEKEEYEIKLYDDHSVLVHQVKSKNKEVKMDISRLPHKVYLLQVSYRGKRATKKVVVGKP